ncbi:MAG TPA: DUF1326 domain-containing protein [Tepidisphaeraceae bacterium]|jgi:hypothetical protein
MKKTLLSAALALAVSSAVSFAGSQQQSNKISGDYVEARTASVFAGACHYNGELVTTGQDAILAWNITAGTWQGTDLAGVKAVAAVSSNVNLANEGARKVELIVDSKASDAQAAALKALLSEKFGAKLGQIVAVRRAPVTFSHTGNDYSVSAKGYAAMDVQPMPNGECCKQPNLVWYSPLVPLEGRKVGFTQTASYTAGTVGDAWQRQGENSAFYGSFQF